MTIPQEQPPSETVKPPRRRGALRDWASTAYSHLSDDGVNQTFTRKLEVVASNLLLAALSISIPLTALLFLATPFLLPYIGIPRFAAFTAYILPATAALLFIDFGIKAAGLVVTHRPADIRRALLSVLAATCLLSVDRLQHGFLEGREAGLRIDRQNEHQDFFARDIRNTEELARSTRALLTRLDSLAPTLSSSVAKDLQAAVIRRAFDPAQGPVSIEAATPYWAVVLDYSLPFALSFIAIVVLLLLRLDPDSTSDSRK